MVGQFQKNEHVAYGSNGVCWIEDIRSMSFSAHKEASLYYILHPVSNSNETIFVPSQSEKLVGRMRPVLCKKEIDDLLHGAKQAVLSWVDDKNSRAVLFRKILSGGDQGELVRLTHCLYLKRQEKTADGKRLAASDETVLRSAEKLVEAEFAFALRIPPVQVSDYIRTQLEIES